MLERVEGVTRFSRFVTHAKLIVPSGADEAAARKLLERAEHGCLIANSLRAERQLDAEIAAGDRDSQPNATARSRGHSCRMVRPTG